MVTNPITQENLKGMRENMDETDLEKFDKFVEKHWGNQLKQPVSVNCVATQEAPKRRGRKPKTKE